MRKKVIIFGGGVAGMSAAHELIERGFDVCVYELQSTPGGKARSIKVPNSGIDGKKELPGEHGFRFFPRFYKHIIDTMKRIPYEGKRSVYDNLVEAENMGVARFDKSLESFPLGFPKSIRDFKSKIRILFDKSWGLSESEIDFFVERLWQVMTSCKERRMEEYERISWWEYLEGDIQSEAFQNMFTGITRSLVAAKAREASMKTIGTMLSQIILDCILPGPSNDRLLNGPTNDVWIDPWLKYLRNRGIQYFTNAKIVSIQCEKGMVTDAIIYRNGKNISVKGDYYLSAMPVEAMEKLITKEMIHADPSLKGMKQLSKSVDWMNGIQFFLRRDIPIVHGHIIFLDAPWALTAVSQPQFWPDIDLRKYGDGTVKGILSIDISEWNMPGILYGKKASDCTKEEIKDEVWAQLKKGLNNDRVILQDEDIHSWFLDPDIVLNNSKMSNLEPLLVNKINTWNLRPYAYTRIPNLFLASDYVRTNTDLATMEAANEAARRAVNNILDISKSKAQKCKIWDMFDYELLTPWHIHDYDRYQKGLPWNGKCSINRRIISFIRYIVKYFLNK
ncbi:hydroxysqualene dehydroxylase [Bacillus taeanensis]|uniref:Phytoene dehydrogenase n=1 Tax=Bacillus taeanensis TaxID=273032 RepID=A0A366XRU6_9BACI|nr:FAD-dependent oxidoreductase [Bacillus taeanensis]RBW67489.1 phytoene dehydrogenase [Bacillus taeanensis]